MARKSPHAAPRAQEPQAGTELFTTLVASRPTREGRAGALAGIVAFVGHVAIVALLFWATMNVGEAIETDETTLIDLFPQPEPEPVEPPPPAPIDEPPPPIDVTEVPRGSISPPNVTIIPPEIPPPAIHSTFDPRDYSGTGVDGGRHDGTASDSVVTAEDLGAAPRLTPFTVAPRITNRDEVARALQRFYPPLLRDAGIGDTVVVWIRIDADGNVVRTQVHQSSGHPSLDEAALRVGEVIEFSPAMNRDRPIAVWVQWPIAFVAR